MTQENEAVEQLIEQAVAQENAEFAEAEAKYIATKEKIFVALGDTPVDIGIPALLDIAFGTIGSSFEGEDKKRVFGYAVDRLFQAITANGIDVPDLFKVQLETA
jgi:hypothetical protein